MRLPRLHIKKLDIFIIKSFTQLLFGTFFICLFIFIMQFLWRWVDEFVGKGLDITILGQFFYLASLTLVGQALPLAILLAALMTFGNFGERLELLAMKAAGIPLLRIMAPIIVECMLLAGISFYFQNVIGPKAQVKLYTILYSIKQTSPEVEIPEGVFYDRIKGYNLFVKNKNKETGILYDVMIYDMSNGFNDARILVADSGKIETTADQQHLLFSLYNGELFENLSGQTNNKNNVPYRRETYSKKVITIEFDGGFNMKDGSFLVTQAASKNMKQLEESIDSLTHHNDSIGLNNWKSAMRNAYPLTNEFSKEDSSLIKRDGITRINIDSIFETGTKNSRLKWKKEELNKIEQLKTDFEIKKNIMRSLDKDLNKHRITWWDKITLSVGCLIFFFIGAPLGAIVRKGGLGYPVLISVATFVLYYIFNTSGYKMAREGEWYIWIGSWLSTLVLTPLGIIFTFQSNRDSTILNIDALKTFFRMFLGLRENRNIPLKEVIIEDPDYTKDYGILSQFITITHKLRKENKLKRMPSIRKVFFDNKESIIIEDLDNNLESLVEEMGNSRNKKIIKLLNDLPIMAPKAIHSPFKHTWMNILSLIIIPVGAIIYIRAWRYRFRLLKDLITIEKTSKKLMDILVKEKLV